MSPAAGVKPELVRREVTLRLACTGSSRRKLT